ncbi:YfhO family protein [Lacticaseibacillus thailandensis]|uniref:YfhO family protein n=1 Tax=Lacticaseibacillus thailandensis TaxID=381741 RepID=UPI0006D068E6
MRKTIRPANLAFYVSSLLVPSIFTILVFFITHVAPFGHNTVASVDFSNQYMALFAYLKRALAGNASWAYSSEFGLGGNVFGVITYYLLSPLNVILLFFHVTELPYFGTLITVVKISLIGFTTFFCFYRSRSLLMRNYCVVPN